MPLPGIALVLFGLALELFFLRQFYLARASLRWRVVQGVIIHSDIEADTSDDTTTYQPVIFYTYTIGGEEFTGDRLGYGRWFSSARSHAQRAFARYPLGKAVSVYVDPQRPSRAVLEPGVNAAAAIFSHFLGLSVIAIGVSLDYFR